jgi:hypothetical protein
VAAIQKGMSLYIPSLKKLCMCNSSKIAVATTIWVTKRGLKKLSNILLIKKHFKSRRLDLLSQIFFEKMIKAVFFMFSRLKMQSHKKLISNADKR